MSLENLEALHTEILIPKLNPKIPVEFLNLKNYDSHLMQELGKFDFEINVRPNRLEKCMNFNINNKLIFIDSFQF